MSQHHHHHHKQVHLIFLSHGNHGSKADWTNIHTLLNQHWQMRLIQSEEDFISVVGEPSEKHHCSEPTWHLLISNANGKKLIDTHVGVLKGGERAAMELLAHVRREWGAMYSIANEASATTDHEQHNCVKRHQESAAKDDSASTATATIQSSPAHPTLIHSNVTINLYWFSHSLGGLFSRAGIGYLAESPEWQCGIIRPRSYISVSSPHLGSRRPGGSSLWRSLKRIAANAYSHTLGQTGDDLFLKNNVLMRLACEDYFTRPLRQFESRTLCAVCHHDVAVPYASASIRAHNPYELPITSRNVKHEFHIKGYSGFHLERHRRLFEALYPHLEPYPSADIVSEFVTKNNLNENGEHVETTEMEPQDTFHSDNYGQVEFSSQMFHSLNSLPWRRIDVQFQSKNRLDQIKMHEVVLAMQKVPLKSTTMRLAGEQFWREVLFPVLWSDRIHSTDFMGDALRGKDDLGLRDVVVVCGGGIAASSEEKPG